MINQFLDVLKLIQFELVGLFMVFFVISFFWKKIYTSLSLKEYSSKHRIHKDEVPRIAGLIIYLFLTVLAFFALNSNLLNIILISAVPLMIIGSIEDLFHNTSPKIRLIFMVLSALLFILLLPSELPDIDLPIINKVLSITFIKETFFIFSILIIINGNNLIDGVNGNMALTNIIQLFVLAQLAFTMNDYQIMKLSIILLIPLLLFFLFNYPFGNIFSGDAGAYFYGFSVSAVVIYLFGLYEQLISWGAVLILIYPSVELLFSFIRKRFYENVSPFTPDTKHLHSLVFRFFDKQFSSFHNSFVVLFLLPFIFVPFVVFLFVNDLFVITLSIFIVFISYVIMYLMFVNIIKKND